MYCADNNCNEVTVGNSKYCYNHRKESRIRFKTMLHVQHEEKERLNNHFIDLFNRADKAGKEAVEEMIRNNKIVPMIVQQHKNALDDNSKVVKEYFVSDGVCGFAWVIINPGNCKMANWAKKNWGASKDYYGGVSLWTKDYNQSMQKKQEYAGEFAGILKQDIIDNPELHGKREVHVYSQSRMD